MANFNTPYDAERDGQIEFFKVFGVDYERDDSILIDNTDGVDNGNLYEFKLTISNLNKTLFQAIKYLSKMRIKGESVPATIILVDLNATTAYVYKSQDYFEAIHKVYVGPASKNNDGFISGDYDLKFDYADDFQASQLKKIVKGNKKDPDEKYMPIDIDENCVVGWATRYFSEKPKASKGDFIGDEDGTAVKLTGEIRRPVHFKGLIRPYKGKTNEKFKYLMDCLNDRLSRKDLGAFYTPPQYAKKSAELVLMAVDRVPDGNDYIILDRCAGTGNLESALVGLKDKNGDDLISHCVVSTYEYYEYKVLFERIGDLVREIIPPTEANVVYENGKVANADALSKEFIENPIIKQYVEDPKCSIILFENPPFSNNTTKHFADTAKKVGKTANRVKSYVFEEFRKYGLPLCSVKNTASNDSIALFVWSGFNYYMRQETDSYIVFAPIQYHKTLGLVHKEFVKGFLLNRKWFHATEEATSCIYWSNKQAPSPEKIVLTVLEIDKDTVKAVKDIDIPRVHKTISVFNDRRNFISDKESGVTCNSLGEEEERKGVRVKYNDNIIGYMSLKGFAIGPVTRYLMRVPYLGEYLKGNGYYLRADVYQSKLPIFCAKLYYQDEWYEKNVLATTSDGGDAYTKDPQFLKACLIYTCLSNQNKCLSFNGSDGRRYQNELCFDDSREKPLALRDLESYAGDEKTALDEEEEALLDLWRKILAEARKADGYDEQFNYGVYQITKDLNTYKEIKSGSAKKREYDNPVLNGHLDTLRTRLKAYYKSHITAKMFEYELLK